MNILMTNRIVYELAMTMIIIHELAPQSPDRGVKNTGRGEAKRNPCKKEPPTKQSAEGATEILSPLSGLQYAHTSYAGVSLRYTTCLCSVAPIRASICSYILRRGSASLHHLPVFCRPYRGFNMLVYPLQGFRSAPPPACVLSPLSVLAITIRINMMPISIIILYELRIMNCEL